MLRLSPSRAPLRIVRCMTHIGPQEMRRISTLVYKKNKRYKQSIELSKQDCETLHVRAWHHEASHCFA